MNKLLNFFNLVSKTKKNIFNLLGNKTEVRSQQINKCNIQPLNCISFIKDWRNNCNWASKKNKVPFCKLNSRTTIIF